MRYRLRVPTLWLLLILCSLSLGKAAEVQLKRSAVTIAERGEVLAYIVTVATNHFQFVPPPQWQVSSKPGESAVVMMSSNLTTSVRIAFIEGKRAQPEKAASHERLVEQRFSSWTLRERFAAQTGLGEGSASDIEREAAEGAQLVSRVIHVTAGQLIVEFTLTAPVNKFPENTDFFASLANSFQSIVPDGG